MTRNLRIYRVFCLFAVWFVYGTSFQNGFHFDDFHTVVDNPAIRSLRHGSRFFTDTTTFSVLPANRTYRPFVSLSLALDYALGGGYKPFWFHAATFVLFLVQLGLMGALYRLLLDRIRPGPVNGWLAGSGAAWYGLHPAMAETVNYVIQRGDLFCTLGCVAGLYLFLRFERLRSTGLYLLPLVFALLSKPPAAVFPALLFLSVYLFEARSHRLRVGLLAALPSVVVTGLLLGLQSAMTPRTFLPSLISPWNYRLTQPYVWLRYCGALFLPIHLNVDTDLKPFDGLNAAACVGLLFVAGLAVAIGISLRRRMLSPIAYGLLWFVVTQLPTSMYPLSEVENDHRMFFSFVGLIFAVVWAGWLVVERLPGLEKRWVMVTAACVGVVVLCGYGYGARVRNGVWRTEETLWKDDVAKSPRNGRGLMIYGLTQMAKGDYPVALDLFERASLLTPNYPALEINLGIVHGAMGRDTEAERHFQRAVALAPEDDSTHAFYGRWLKERRQTDEAVGQLQTAVRLNPLRVFQRDVLIVAYEDSGDFDAAHEQAQETLALAPDDQVAMGTLKQEKDEAFWINLSLVRNRAGRYRESIAAAQEAIRLDKQSAIAWNNIAADHAALREWKDAIAAADEAIALKPDFQLARNNLAWALQQQKAR